MGSGDWGTQPGWALKPSCEAGLPSAGPQRSWKEASRREARARSGLGRTPRARDRWAWPSWGPGSGGKEEEMQGLTISVL